MSEKKYNNKKMKMKKRYTREKGVGGSCIIVSWINARRKATTRILYHPAQFNLASPSRLWHPYVKKTAPYCTGSKPYQSPIPIFLLHTTDRTGFLDPPPVHHPLQSILCVYAVAIHRFALLQQGERLQEQLLTERGNRQTIVPCPHARICQRPPVISPVKGTRPCERI